ncbi:macrolide transporter [Jeotgalibacillus malaysiensis]|uniref:Macrolide transporter n=1 Tax=Jeotgalibacillus malaysiensis TaxID=1508404 RepID=A0A0B5API3_9BACL|nr:MFS transporter [Jeotgalibacillus malaysiensis]AJD89999.1 macrolide transporter [Jeotgalibacillus malaysiensis]
MLRNRNVWILLAGEFIAGVGLWLGIIGNLEFMQEKVPSDFVKSLILGAGLLASILIGPLAGRLIDQLHKKTVMLASGFVRAVSVIFMLIAIQQDSIVWMIVFLVFIQVAAAFYFPALQAALPLVVAERDLLQLNGIHMNVATLSRVLGTAIAGVLVVQLPLSNVYLLSLVSYLILFGLTWLLVIEEHQPTRLPSEGKKSAGFKEVFPIIKGLPIVMMTLILTLVPLLFIGGFNLVVINISEIQDSAAIKGWIYTAEGIAFMAGAFVIKKLGEAFSPYSILFTFSFVIGFSQLILFFAEIPFLTILSFIIFGFAVGCFFPTAATIFQTRIPKEFHGRFFSFRNMLDRIVFQIVLLMTGLFLDLIGLVYMVIVFGVFSLALTGVFYMRFNRLQNSEKLAATPGGMIK